MLVHHLYLNLTLGRLEASESVIQSYSHRHQTKSWCKATCSQQLQKAWEWVWVYIRKSWDLEWSSKCCHSDGRKCCLSGTTGVWTINHAHAHTTNGWECLHSSQEGFWTERLCPDRLHSTGEYLSNTDHSGVQLKKKKKSGEKLILDRLDRLAQLALELSKLHATVTPRAYLTTLQFVVVTANTLLMSAAAVFWSCADGKQTYNSDNTMTALRSSVAWSGFMYIISRLMQPFLLNTHTELAF